MAIPSDIVTLEVGGEKFTGWQDIKISRGVETFPSSFALRITERLPDQPKMFPIDPGTRCRLLIGSDLIVTGYVDAYDAKISTRGHEITVTGRSQTEDLVDCAAGFTPGHETEATLTFSAPTLLQLAQDLCGPFGIKVTAPDGEGSPLVSIGDGIPQFTVALGTTVWDVLEPKTRWRRLIMLDGTDGNLILAKVGARKAASGFTLPGSVLDASVTFGKQDRFSIYLPAMFAFDRARDVNAALHTTSSNYLKPVRDDAAFRGQPRADGGNRYRPHVVVSEQALEDIHLAENLATWELARRYGRSQAVRATVALWRDSAGKLWTPNTLAQVDMPALKLAKLEWLIAQVVYLKGFGTGTRSIVTLMPKEAFEPQPTLDAAYDPQVAAALAEALRTSRPSVATDPRPVSVTQGSGV